MKKTTLLYALIFLFLRVTASAQTFEQDTLFIQAAVNNATQRYTKVIQGQLQLYNGSDYAEYQPTDDEHPYFLSDDWVFGSVYYDGNLYEQTAMLYNIASDELITEHYYTSNLMRLVTSKIQYFTLGSRKFVPLKNESLTEGFYELLYNGTSKVYARHTKNIQESIEAMEIHREFEEKTRYYVFKDGNYIAIKNKKSILSVLGDKKRELNQFMNKSKIRFRKNREQYIVKAVEFYDHS